MSSFFNPQNEARSIASQTVGRARSGLMRNVPIRNTLIYMMAVFLVFCGIGFLGYFMAAKMLASSENLAFWNYNITLLVVLLIGWLHVSTLRWGMPWITSDDYLLGTLMTFLMSIIAGLAMFLVSYSPKMFGFTDGSTNEDYKIFVRPLITIIPVFLLPYFITWAFDAYQRIPAKIYKVWKYDPSMLRPKLSAADLKHMTDVIFVLDLQLGEQKIYDIVTDIPNKLAIGEAFQLAINEHNAAEPLRQIDVRDPMNPDSYTNLYEWHFYVQRSWWRNNLYIDPYRNCPENYVTNGARIIARRLVPKHD
ncbi:TssN family type VI secretion system protein [Dyadobacter jiangsuensis]|uniref:Uncharacterized protein n=1 Tax=Dyadobacter jiangsuensis TaxID=1591085 RepID=A0A2P8G0L3_9BACT|nr:TssN family type VI secretion system protein [Dyadobacter jiangsuensis]PSL27435.1 hypothetical protein CLV60_108293 [Dyadobacter jiangsuensis]